MRALSRFVFRVTARIRASRFKQCYGLACSGRIVPRPKTVNEGCHYLTHKKTNTNRPQPLDKCFLTPTLFDRTRRRNLLSSQEEVFLSQFSKGLSERRLAFIDRDKELWLCPVLPAQSKGASPAKHKLHTQVRREAGDSARRDRSTTRKNVSRYRKRLGANVVAAEVSVEFNVVLALTQLQHPSLL